MTTLAVIGSNEEDINKLAKMMITEANPIDLQIKIKYDSKSKIRSTSG